jgi:SCY1-like protein 1
MNVELMKHFARLQGQDDQGMIRTNTTVCIGKIAPYINPALRQRILLSAFPKAMRDPFPLSRLSGIVAFANTDHFYTLKDIASKVLPSLCMLTIDPEKDVRDEAFKTIAKFLQKLEKVSEKPELALEMEKDVQSCSLDLKNETSWTSWAMTSLSAKMTGYKNKGQQASVALNTQPLGPPPSMTTQASPAAANKELTPEKNIVKQKEETKTNPKLIEKIEEKSSNNFESGWNLDNNEWKDLDDDDMEPMEPLEPIKPSINLSTKVSPNVKPAQNSDWSTNWTNSFDENPSETQDDFSGFGFSVNNKPATKIAKLPSKQNDSNVKPASSYNWNSTNTALNQEEELFSSLVKDISIGNKTVANASTNKNDSSGWNENEWSDVFDNRGSTGWFFILFNY